MLKEWLSAPRPGEVSTCALTHICGADSQNDPGVPPVVGVQNPTEPIPGYQLLERLGQGGFGEVWKARAPGGLLKAIKIVHGCLHGSADDELCVRQELKALERVKSVRHPYILSLERYDIIEGQLFIVMELADRSLWDRYQECRTQGLPGIPRDEMLRYMEETAEALDLMNREYQLQHLDIKPQNIFLVHNHVKVADFGLVNSLSEAVTTKLHAALNAVTPLYAAPELFLGKLSRQCDQYSLAIVYQELLTGSLPFTGKNLRQLLLQHTQDDPGLRALSIAHRAPAAARLSEQARPAVPPRLAIVRQLGHPPSGVRSPSRPSGRKTRIRIKIANTIDCVHWELGACQDSPSLNCWMSPIRIAPSTAPGRFPIPPSTAAVNANRPSWKPWSNLTEVK